MSAGVDVICAREWRQAETIRGVVWRAMVQFVSTATEPGRQREIERERESQSVGQSVQLMPDCSLTERDGLIEGLVWWWWETWMELSYEL